MMALTLASGAALYSARAGDWVVDRNEYGGKKAITEHTDAWTTYPVIAAFDNVTLWQTDGYHDTGPHNSGFYTEVYGSAGYSYDQGQARTWFKWVPSTITKDGNVISDPNDKPSRLYVLVTMSGSAFATGIGRKVSVKVMGKTATPTAENNSWFGAVTKASLEVKKLELLVPNSTNSKVVGSLTYMSTPWYVLDATATVPGSRTVWKYYGEGASYADPEKASLRTSGEYSAVKDDRSVSISRANDGGATTVNSQGISVASGDSTYSYAGEGNLFISEVPNWLNFTASIPGWPASSTFKWSSPDPSDTKTAHTQKATRGTMTLGNNNVWRGTPTGPSAPIDIVYTITDSETASGSAFVGQAHYMLTLHDEYEVDGPITTALVQGKTLIVSPLFVSNRTLDAAHPPGPMPASYTISYDETATQDFTTEQDRSAQIDAEGKVSSSKLLPFLTAKGVDASISGKAHIAVSSEDKRAQQSSQGFSYTVQPAIQVYAGNEAIPIIIPWSKVRTYTVRHYGSQGLLETTTRTVTQFDHYEPTWDYHAVLPYNGSH